MCKQRKRIAGHVINVTETGMTALKGRCGVVSWERIAGSENLTWMTVDQQNVEIPSKMLEDVPTVTVI